MAPFLETGHQSAITEAKKEWRRKYKAAWRKQKRKQVKEITTAWEKEEYRILKEEARRHKESITRFIKRSAVAYMDKRYVVPDEDKVTKMTQLLGLLYNRVLELTEDTTIPADAGRKVLFEIQELEREVRIALYSPKTIEQHIGEAIKQSPEIKNRLIAFIQTLPP
jgi:hypothetical protein